LRHNSRLISSAEPHALGANIDRSLMAAEEPMIKFLDGLAEPCKSGALPRNFATIDATRRARTRGFGG
jgi:hypothetical protein